MGCTSSPKLQEKRKEEVLWDPLADLGPRKKQQLCKHRNRIITRSVAVIPVRFLNMQTNVFLLVSQIPKRLMLMFVSAALPDGTFIYIYIRIHIYIYIYIYIML